MALKMVSYGTILFSTENLNSDLEESVEENNEQIYLFNSDFKFCVDLCLLIQRSFIFDY
jgi:hypothetical protein